MPCCFSAAEPPFSCSLVGQKNECILSFTISLKSDNVFEEQNSCSGGCVCWGEAVICALSKEGLTKWVLFSSKHCQRSEAPYSREALSPSHFSPHRPPPRKSHCHSLLPWFRNPSCSCWLLEKPWARFNRREFVLFQELTKEVLKLQCSLLTSFLSVSCTVRKANPIVKGSDTNTSWLGPGKIMLHWERGVVVVVVYGLVYFDRVWLKY